MQFRLLKRRTVSALATTALAAGALTVPVALLAAPAQAGEATGAFSCSYGNFKLGYSATIDVDGGWDNTAGVKKFAFDGELSDMTLTGVPSAFVNFPDVTITATVDGTMGDTPVALTGQGPGTFIGGGKLDIPTVKGQVGAVDAASTLTVSKITLKVVSNDPAKPLTANMPCTTTAPVDVQALPSLVMACTTFGSTFGYAADPTVSAAATLDGKVRMTVGLDAMPGVVPVPLTDVPVSGTLDIESDGVSAQLTGTHTVPSVPPGQPIPVPLLVGEMGSSDSSTITFSVESAAFVATAMGSAVSIPCTVNSAASYTVDVRPVTEACIDADAALTSAEAGLASATTAANNAAAVLATATAAAATASGAVDSATAAVTAATAGVNAANAKVAAATTEVDAATAAVAAAPAEIAAATAKADAATAAVNAASAAASSANSAASKATKAATKAAAAYKKASTKAKKAKGKKAKAKAKKAKSKASKAKSKANQAKSKANKAKAQAGQALSAATAQLNTATAQLATAKAKPAAASARLTAAKAALVTANAELVTAKEKSASAATALEAAKSALVTANADLQTAKDQSAAADLELAAAESAVADAQAAVDEEC